MTLSSIFISGFLVCAAIFLGVTVWDWLIDWSFLSSFTLLGASGYCGLIALLIWGTHGIARGMFMIMSMSIFIVYILRLFVLVIEPNDFLHQDLPVVFSDETVSRALVFMAIGTVCLAIGLWIGTWRSSGSQESLMEDGEDQFLFRHRTLITLVGYGFAFAHLILQMTMYGVGVNQLAGEFWFVRSLMPLFLFLLVVMYILVKYWRRISWIERLFIVGIFVVGIAGDIVHGGRTTIVGIIQILLLVVIVLNPDVRVNVVKWLALAFLSALVFLFLIRVATVMRFDWSSIGGFSPRVLVSEVVSQPLGVTRPNEMNEPRAFKLLEIPGGLTRLRPGFDALVATMNYRPQIVEDEVTLKGFAIRVVNRLTPGDLVGGGNKSFGEIFGQEYQGVESGHSGGWYGFGITYGLFGSIGPLALLIYAILVGVIIRIILTIAINGPAIVRGARVPLVATLYWGFAILLIEQGSIDNHLSAIIREIIMGGLVLLFIQVVASAVQYQRFTRGVDTQS